MTRILGLDIGTTSVGFALIDSEPPEGRPAIVRMGVRIFPEARDPKGVPLNQQRRDKRIARRQLRRRRERRPRVDRGEVEEDDRQAVVAGAQDPAPRQHLAGLEVEELQAEPDPPEGRDQRRDSREEQRRPEQLLTSV